MLPADEVSDLFTTQPPAEPGERSATFVVGNASRPAVSLPGPLRGRLDLGVCSTGVNGVEGTSTTFKRDAMTCRN
jgi:hypothetical protein